MDRARTLVIFLMLAGLLGMARPPATIHGAGSLTLPPGFVDETVVSGLTTPRAFVFAPDGRIFIAERGRATSNDINFASIRVFKNGALLAQRAISFDVCGDGERGFLGMALDPNFAGNGYIYVYYTRQATSGAACAYNAGAAGPRNRVSRVTMTGDTAGDERVLVDNMPSDSGIHNSGDLHFGPDGNLYITAGDGGAPPSPAQNLASLGGKMLRIRPTAGGGYTIPDDNPYKNASGARLCGATPPPSGSGPCQEIFAYGLRNPFRFTIQPGTGVPFAFDVGGSNWEEIDRIVNSGNYGYALREGPCPAGSFCTPTGPSGYEDPIYSYAHNPGTGGTDNAAVIGGAFYSGSGYPAEYQGNLFFGDFVRGWIKRLLYDGASDTWSAQPFATGGDSIIGLRIGLDTNLYYLEIGSDFDSKIHRIRYEQGVNQPPTAQIAANPLNGPLNTVYTFSAAGSSDPEQGTLTYNWDLGDGTITSTSVPTITHQYATPGVKTITLTVTDNGTPPATSAPASVQVFPGNGPPGGTIGLANLTAPGRADRYYAGDSWRASAENLSDDQTPVEDLRLKWTVEFHHREHMHPFVTEAEGAQKEFTIPPIGETDPVVWYHVILRITDAQSQTTTIARDLFPSTATITLTTDPVGGQVALGEKLHTAPYTATRVVGINDQIGVPSPQTIGGAPFTFAHWSNGQPQEQTITVPLAGETYTAVLQPEPVELPERRIYLALVAR